MALIFEPHALPRGWTVRDAATRDLVGSVEWHDRLGVYGFASRPGLPFFFDRPALAEIGRFVDGANAE